ncbi:MAG: hypothetical protein M3Q23_11835 [Actinomycetota bacterium]|nr:hypothetical protein [Actinomycetota bacterium]
MIRAREVDAPPGDFVARPAPARAIVALARVEGTRLARHPAIIVTVAITFLQSAPALLSSDYTSEHNVGWLIQVPALLISFGALLAANLQALKSRRDGSEELFQAAPLSPARRTLALALAAVWVMAVLTLLLLAGDVAVRAAGKGAATDTGQALFPLFDLVQGPLLAGLFVVIGIAVARWFPNALAGPVTLVAMVVAGTRILHAATDQAWLRLTPFDPTFLDDGGTLQAMHVVYLGGLAAVVLAIALLRFGWTRSARTWLIGGGVAAAASGAFQLAS